MKRESIIDEYSKYSKLLQDFQFEIFNLVESYLSQFSESIDIEDITQRQGNTIKSLKSILDNFDNHDKYKKIQTVLDIKDIAGVRITCYCEDDYQNLKRLLGLYLSQKYIEVEEEEKGFYKNKGKSQPGYRALHFSIAKAISLENVDVIIRGEIQLRTVMGNAWAILDRRYVYGIFKEGEPAELTTGASKIVDGCENIWNVIKEQSKKKAGIKTVKIIKPQSQPGESSTKYISQTSYDLADWVKENKKNSEAAINEFGSKAFLETLVFPNKFIDQKINQKSLLEISEKSTIKTFGWPIGVVIRNDSTQPIIDANGVHEVIIERGLFDKSDARDNVFDYWAIHRNGAFYAKSSLFEDTRKDNVIFFDTRIVRTSELLMYISNFYKNIGIPAESIINFELTYVGISDRTLTAAGNRLISGNYKFRDSANYHTSKLSVSLSEIDNNMSKCVKELCEPFFIMFDGFEIGDQIYENIVNNYRDGKVT